VTELIQLTTTAVRLLLAVGFIAFLPGFALSWWLFSKLRIDLLERIFISIITSLVLSGFAAYGLVVFEFGLSAARLLIVLGLLTVFFTAGAFRVRRWQGSLSNIAISRFHRVLHRARQDMPLAILTGIFFVFLAAGFSLHLNLAEDTDTLPITEFYLNPFVLAENGVLFTVEEGNITVPVTIMNREGEDRAYRIESVFPQVLNASSGQMNMLLPVNSHDKVLIEHIEVAASKMWTGTVSIHLPEMPVDYVEIHLFYAGHSTPHAMLRIWVSDS
jgi:uncharacterized membrane protein